MAFANYFYFIVKDFEMVENNEYLVQNIDSGINLNSPISKYSSEVHFEPKYMEGIIKNFEKKSYSKESEEGKKKI